VKARFLATAELELKEAMEFYEAAREGLGVEFLTEIDVTVSLIEAHPLAWTALSPRTRRCRTSRFPFGLFYQVRSDEILIVSVMISVETRNGGNTSCNTTLQSLPSRWVSGRTTNHHEPSRTGRNLYQTDESANYGDVECAGINRRVVENERVLQERRRDPS
jgi:ParE toxin of type II toxin-antitoxin system, parDE